MTKNLSSLKQRILTAVVLAPIVLAITFFASSDIFAVLLALILTIAAFEWGRLAQIKTATLHVLFIACNVLMFFLFITYLQSVSLSYLLYFAGLWWLGLLLFVASRKSLVADSSSAVSLAKLVQGLLTLLPAFVAMFFIHQTYSAWMIFYLFLIIWGADIGAYFSGKRFGKNKLAPVLSPGKTIEGVIGGLLLVVLLSLAVSLYLFETTGDRVIFILLAIIIVCFSIVGDLYESLLKREAAVKDSSNILPGHGGVLDRIDSLLAAAPLFLLFYSLYFAA